MDTPVSRCPPASLWAECVDVAGSSSLPQTWHFQKLDGTNPELCDERMRPGTGVSPEAETQSRSKLFSIPGVVRGPSQLELHQVTCNKTLES